MIIADLLVRAALLTILAGTIPLILALLAEQVSLIRTSITKENHHHDRTDA